MASESVSNAEKLLAEQQRLLSDLQKERDKVVTLQSKVDALSAVSAAAAASSVSVASSASSVGDFEAQLKAKDDDLQRMEKALQLRMKGIEVKLQAKYEELQALASKKAQVDKQLEGSLARVDALETRIKTYETKGMPTLDDITLLQTRIAQLEQELAEFRHIQDAQLQHIEAFVGSLTQGVEVLLHTMTGPQRVNMKMKGGLLYWREGKKLLQIKLLDIVNILPGCETATFKVLNLPLDVAAACFSIQSETMVVDIQTASPDDCHLWLGSLHTILTTLHAEQASLAGDSVPLGEPSGRENASVGSPVESPAKAVVTADAPTPTAAATTSTGTTTGEKKKKDKKDKKDSTGVAQ